MTGPSADALNGSLAAVLPFPGATTLTPAQRAVRTKRAQRAGARFRKGQRVLTWTPRSPRFHQRVGVVVDPNNLGEVGLTFLTDPDPDGRLRVDAWFLPAELEPVAE